MVNRQMIHYRYAVRVTLYDDNLNIKKRFEKQFRLRREAEDWSKSQKESYRSQQIISDFQVIKMETNTVVSKLKSHKMIEKQKGRKRKW